VSSGSKVGFSLILLISYVPGIYLRSTFVLAPMALRACFRAECDTPQMKTAKRETRAVLCDSMEQKRMPTQERRVTLSSLGLLGRESCCYEMGVSSVPRSNRRGRNEKWAIVGLGDLVMRSLELNLAGRRIMGEVEFLSFASFLSYKSSSECGGSS